jgi:hypothetical protein
VSGYSERRKLRDAALVGNRGVSPTLVRRLSTGSGGAGGEPHACMRNGIVPVNATAVDSRFAAPVVWFYCTAKQ